MLRRRTFGLLAIAAHCWLAAQVVAQEDRYVRPTPTLGERLEQFRSDLTGESPDEIRSHRQPGRSVGNSGGSSVRSAASKAQSGINTQPVQSSNPKPNGQGKSSGTSGKNGGQQANRPRPKAAAPAAETPTVADAESEPAAKREPTVAAEESNTSKKSSSRRVVKTDRPAVKPDPEETLDPEQESFETAEPAPKKPSRPSQRVARAERAEVTPPEEETQREPAPEAPPKRPATVQRPANNGEAVLFSGQSPQLSVEAAGPRKIIIGKEAAFAIRVRNSGDVAANNVVVTINVPSFAEIVSSQATAGSPHVPGNGERTEPIQWHLSKLDAHSRETLTLKLVPRKSLPIDLGVQWTCSPEASQMMVEVQEPKLVMSLSGPEEVMYGQSKVYKLTMSNPGNGDAENVMVSLLPIGRATEGATSHKMGVLRAGDSKTIEVELTARQSGNLLIKAQAYADGGLRAESTQEVLVRRANLKVTTDCPKVKYAGTTASYQIHVVNTGNAPAGNVQVSAILPPDAKYVACKAGGKLEADRAKVTWMVGMIPAGAERILELQCGLHAAGENRLQVLAIGESELTAAATAVTRVEAVADLKLEVRDPQGPVPVGDDAVYEVVLRNRGTKSAEGVELVVFFSEGLEATSVQGGPHEIGQGEVVFKTMPSLAAGSENTFRIHTKAATPGNHVLRAEVICRSLNTKLAAEETTHFYGEDEAGSAER